MHTEPHCWCTLSGYIAKRYLKWRSWIFEKLFLHNSAESAVPFLLTKDLLLVCVSACLWVCAYVRACAHDSCKSVDTCKRLSYLPTHCTCGCFTLFVCAGLSKMASEIFFFSQKYNQTAQTAQTLLYLQAGQRRNSITFKLEKNKSH